MCTHRPCWPTPDEAKRIVAAGFGDRLMMDWWDSDQHIPEHVHIISPAVVGYEGKSSPFWPEGRCTFLSQDGKCELHPLGLKPVEGRLALCSASDQQGKRVHRLAAMSWFSQAGKRIAASWQKRFWKDSTLPEDKEDDSFGGGLFRYLTRG